MTFLEKLFLGLLMTAIVLCSVLLIIAVLMQPPQEDGDLGSGRSLGAQHMFSAVQAPYLLEKVTYALAAILVALVLGATSFLLRTKQYTTDKSVLQEEKWATGAGMQAPPGDIETGEAGAEEPEQPSE